MKLAVIGTGYVGLVTGTCFSETGNDVICLDTDAEKIRRLQGGEIPFYEPGLPDLVARNMKEGRLRFSTEVTKGIQEAEVCFICVGTPSKDDGSAEMNYVLSAADAVAKTTGEKILVVKSTVPVGTSDLIRSRLKEKGREGITVVSNPEFLREGTAIQDCMLPDRVVVGTEIPAVMDLFRELYSPYLRTGSPIFFMDARSSEMTKYAANSLLALRISFMNEVATLCDAVGADVTRVREGIGSDRRIGMQYLFPSVGFGGSCFPKDVRALAFLAKLNKVPSELLDATLQVNEDQKRRFVERITQYFASQKPKPRIAMWGLAFKAKTDDIRYSPALDVVDGLLGQGFQVTVYDPVAMPNARAQYGDRLTYAESENAAIEGASALCVLTEWNQFRHPDFTAMKKMMKEAVIFDGRNLYEAPALRKAGFKYFSIGRPVVG